MVPVSYCRSVPACVRLALEAQALDLASMLEGTASSSSLGGSATVPVDSAAHTAWSASAESSDGSNEVDVDADLLAVLGTELGWRRR